MREGLLSKEKILGHIGEVAGVLTGRASEEEITVFDGTGLALEADAAVAYMASNKARKANSGAYPTLSLI